MPQSPSLQSDDKKKEAGDLLPSTLRRFRVLSGVKRSNRKVRSDTPLLHRNAIRVTVKDPEVRRRRGPCFSSDRDVGPGVPIVITLNGQI